MAGIAAPSDADRREGDEIRRVERRRPGLAGRDTITHVMAP
jgi:hypothetical protein